MKLEIQIPYIISLDLAYKIHEMLESVRKPSEQNAHMVIKLQPQDSGISGTIPPYSTIMPDATEIYELTVPKCIPLVTPENCEYVCHVLRNTHNEAWCGATDIKHKFTFVNAEHAANSGAVGNRLMSCWHCNQAIMKALDSGWDEDHQPDSEDEE